MKNSKLIAVIMIIMLGGWGLLAAVSVKAADSVGPNYNPLCWKLEDCKEARKASIFRGDAMSDETAKEGWVEGGECVGGTDPNTKWGKCLGAGQTVTSISIGGNRKFLNVGDYIQKVYNYAVGAAGVLAVIVIIVAGAQWIVSGGNAEVVGKARKRVGGAIIGLLILFSSYVILNTINPALVNLRLPQIWMIRTIEMPYLFCADSKPAELPIFAPAGKSSERPSKEKYDQAVKDSKFAIRAYIGPDWLKSLKCGEQFFVQGANGRTCQGSYCAEGAGTCFPPMAKNEKEYECKPATIGGRFIYSGEISHLGTGFKPGCVVGNKGWEYPWVTKAALVAFSTGGDFVEVCSTNDLKQDAQEKSLTFLIDCERQTMENLKIRSGFIGYGLSLMLDDACGDDEERFVGKNNLEFLDLTTVDAHALYPYSDFFTPASDPKAPPIKKGVFVNIDVGHIIPDVVVKTGGSNKVQFEPAPISNKQY